MTERALAILALALAASCRSEAPKPASQVVQDWRGKAVQVPLSPKRIVSIVPSCTELLFAAGAGAQVAGVTTYCTYPAEANSRTRVGDLSINYEVLKSLDPDLVVSGWTMAKSSVMAIEEMGLPVFCVDPKDFPDIARALRTLGRITGHEGDGERAAKELEARVAAVEARVAGKSRPAVCLEMTSTPHVAVPGTYGHDVIVRAGGRNVFEDLAGDRFAAVSWESVLSRDPEVYVVGHGHGPPAGRPGFSKLRAAREGRVFTLEMESLVYPTPRLLKGLETLAEKLHP